ncbi:MAG: endolytic transglycosylase MltG [Nitrospirae bacterium]|nr:MAG: endolytic transglycosylase MltG [Nitrospirota bacterium]
MDWGHRQRTKFWLGLGLSLVLVGGWVWAHLQPVGSPDRHVRIEVPPGTTFSEVADRLAAKHLIRSKWVFLWVGRLTGAERRILPGEYDIHGGMTAMDIIHHLVHGQVVQHLVTIPEGYSVRQIAELLARKRLTDRNTFLRLTVDPEFIHTLGLQVSSLEGYLFPDSYLLTRFMEPEIIIRRMVERLHHVWTPERRARARELGMSLHEVLTLASVIEKETGDPTERGLISGVFHNRLRRQIPLQSDPTVIYAIKEFDGNLRKSDLRIESPYNTYRVTGLPPGPIANPGEAAIHAALYPASTPFMYFVSRNDGSHHFSRTLAEHQRAVQKYQLGPFRRSS